MTPSLPTSSLMRRPCVSGEFLPVMSVCLTSSRYVNPCQDALVSALQSAWKAAGTFSPPPTRPRAQIPCLCILKGFRFIWKDNLTWGDFKTTRKLRLHPQAGEEGNMSAVSFLKNYMDGYTWMRLKLKFVRCFLFYCRLYNVLIFLPNFIREVRNTWIVVGAVGCRNQLCGL